MMRFLDGVNWRRRTRKLRTRSSASSLSSVSDQEPTTPSNMNLATKSVTWGPLSPKSSVTLERHRQAHVAEEAQAAAILQEPPSLSEAQLASLRPVPFRRRSSDPTANRPVIPRRSIAQEEDIEDLPDRFDSQGRPLDGHGPSSSRSHYRSGSFEVRPQRPGDWDVRGSWAMAGNDDEAVQKLMGDVQGIITGQKRWTDLLQDVLGAASAGRQIEDADEEAEQRRRRRRRGRSE